MAGRAPRAAVRAAVGAGLADLSPGDRVVVALSGGPDSLALLAGTLAVAQRRGLVCGAVVVDHRLQPGSAAVAARAAEQARRLGCADVSVVVVSVEAGPGSGGPEAAARTARYAALAREAGAAPGAVTRPLGDPPREGTPRRAAAVLLGHTRDDQAETVLLGLARGSGTRSLAGMAPRSGLFRRPLLDLPRGVVAEAAAAAQREDPELAPWSDPQNEDPVFARARVRHEVLPLLERALGPGVAEALARTAVLAREDADALDAWADRIWDEVIDPGTGLGTDALRAEGEVVRVPLAALRPSPDAVPAAVASRVLRRLLIAAGCPSGSLTAAHVRAVRGLVDGSQPDADVALPGGRRARREGGDLVVRA